MLCLLCIIVKTLKQCWATIEILGGQGVSLTIRYSCIYITKLFSSECLENNTDMQVLYILKKGILRLKQ